MRSETIGNLTKTWKINPFWTNDFGDFQLIYLLLETMTVWTTLFCRKERVIYFISFSRIYTIVMTLKQCRFRAADCERKKRKQSENYHDLTTCMLVTMSTAKKILKSLVLREHKCLFCKRIALGILAYLKGLFCFQF